MLAFTDDNRTLFEISDRLDKMNQIFGRLTWLERTGMDALLPDYVADMLLPASHSTLRVSSPASIRSVCHTP